MSGELQLALLGNPEIRLDGVSLTSLRYSKAQALLYFLAVTGRPHLRPALAGLLWGEMPEDNARRNLRKALADLRRLVRPHLQVSRQAVAFNQDSAYWLDVESFEAHVGSLSAEVAVDELQAAIELYRGDFLEGFYVRRAPAFEAWVQAEQARLRELALQTLHTLVVHFSGLAEAGMSPGIHYVTRLLALDPGREEAHRQLMLLLAHSGQRSAALARYETCRQVLAEELGVEPDARTTALYQRILDGELDRDVWPQTPMGLTAPAARPAFLSITPARRYAPAPFVARERELAQLGRFLESALDGQGRVVFVSGEAGSGKTALVQEFARRAQDARDELIVAGGNCDAYTGVGDPYLPFREILGLLTGDVEARWAAGEMSQDHARRLWALTPHSISALVSDGSDLIGVFTPGPALAARARVAAPAEGSLADLERIVAQGKAEPGTADLFQTALFAQYARVLQALAREQPLLLILDDLQWADAGSLGLLFHLGRRLQGTRILILGIYRPADVAVGRDGAGHPLEPLIAEFQRRFGQSQVDLRQTQDRQFVESLIDTVPNELGPKFRKALFEQTRGHALFTVEMLRGMRERGDIVQNERGDWVEGPTLDWKTLPARIEGVTGQRISRLPAYLQDMLKVASIEGEAFTAEVVARVQAADELETVRQLSSALDQRHRLVRSRGSHRPGRQRRSRYQFRHILFQRYIYDSLDVAERAYLHEAVGCELERLYEGRTEEAAVELARHFEEAGLMAKAVDYLHQAGRRASRLFANEEAIDHFAKALELLETRPATQERFQQELALQIALASPLAITQGYGAPETEGAYLRAWDLCQQPSVRGEGEPWQEFAVLRGLWNCYSHQAELRRSQSLAEQLLALAEDIQNPVFLMQAHWVLGENSFFLGELEAARTHFEAAIGLYDPQTYRAQPFRAVQDPGPTCRSFAGLTLWLLGYPDQALERMQEALNLAQEQSHPITLHHTLAHANWLHQFRGEGQQALDVAEAAIAHSTKQGWDFRLQHAIVYRAAALIVQGKIEEGLVLLNKTFEGLGDVEVQTVWAPWGLGLRAEANLKAGLTEEGLVRIAEALAAADRSEGHFYKAELYRLKGELLLQKAEADAGAEDGIRHAEGCFRRAVAIARHQGAKSLELRAVIGLSRLWHARGSPEKSEKARQMLAMIYGWFAEGFDTADLREAKALLEGLSRTE